MKRVASEIDFDRLLVETDAPFLAPSPHRGRRNEPAYVRLVAEEVAQQREWDLESVAQQTSRNARMLFTRLSGSEQDKQEPEPG
jgi:TatD DNase family protein